MQSPLTKILAHLNKLRESAPDPEIDPHCIAIAQKMADVATQIRSDLQQLEQLRHIEPPTPCG